MCTCKSVHVNVYGCMCLHICNHKSYHIYIYHIYVYIISIYIYIMYIHMYIYISYIYIYVIYIYTHIVYIYIYITIYMWYITLQYITIYIYMYDIHQWTSGSPRNCSACALEAANWPRGDARSGSGSVGHKQVGSGPEMLVFVDSYG